MTPISKAGIFFILSFSFISGSAHARSIITSGRGVIYQTNKIGDSTEGFISISNAGSSPDTLTGSFCPIANSTELVGPKGSPLVALHIPARQTVSLTPSGPHLVLRGTHFRIVQDSVVPCTLSFQAEGNQQGLLSAKKTAENYAYTSILRSAKVQTEQFLHNAEAYFEMS